jgi:hypothetical protein
MIIKILIATALLITGGYLFLKTTVFKQATPLPEPAEQIVIIPDIETQELSDSTEVVMPDDQNSQDESLDESAVDQIQKLEQCGDAFAVAAQAFSELNYEKLSPCLNDPAVFILSESSYMPTLNKNAFIKELIFYVPNVTSWTTDQNDATIHALRNTNPEVANSIIFIADDKTSVMLDVDTEGKIESLRLLDNYTYWLGP